MSVSKAAADFSLQWCCFEGWFTTQRCERCHLIEETFVFVTTVPFLSVGTQKNSKEVEDAKSWKREKKKDHISSRRFGEIIIERR